jgi:hypothetical protein
VRLVAAQDEAVKLWIYERYGVLTGGRPCEAWGVVDGAGAIVGAFVLTHEHNRTMELHLYGREPQEQGDSQGGAEVRVSVRGDFPALLRAGRGCTVLLHDAGNMPVVGGE